MSTQPRKTWRVVLTQNEIPVAEVEHTSEAKAFEHVRMALRSGANAAKIMQWSEGQWWHFKTVHAEDMP